MCQWVLQPSLVCPILPWYSLAGAAVWLCPACPQFYLCWWMLQPSPAWLDSSPRAYVNWWVLWLNLAQSAPCPSSCICQWMLQTGPALPAPDQAHMYASGYCGPAWPRLPSVSALVLTSTSCSLTRAPKFAYQISSQLWIWTSRGCLAQSDMAHLQFQQSQVSATIQPCQAHPQVWLSCEPMGATT